MVLSPSRVKAKQRAFSAEMNSVPAPVTIRAPKVREVVVPEGLKVKQIPAPEFMGPGALVQIAVATLLGLGLAHWMGWSIAAGLGFGLALSGASTVGLLRAMADFPVKRELSFLIGDKEADLEAARAAGVAGFLFTGGNLAQFAEWTLAGFEDGHRG